MEKKQFLPEYASQIKLDQVNTLITFGTIGLAFQWFVDMDATERRFAMMEYR